MVKVAEISATVNSESRVHLVGWEGGLKNFIGFDGLSRCDACETRRPLRRAYHPREYPSILNPSARPSSLFPSFKRNSKFSTFPLESVCFAPS